MVRWMGSLNSEGRNSAQAYTDPITVTTKSPEIKNFFIGHTPTETDLVITCNLRSKGRANGQTPIGEEGAGHSLDVARSGSCCRSFF